MEPGMMELTDGLSVSVLAAAATIGFVHTLLGPDHYVPFISLARVQNWTLLRTLATVAACGVAHVLGSAALGSIGLATGAAIGNLDALETGRGDFAAWAMVLFGLAYFSWGLRRGLVTASGLTPHAHGDHVHIHRHGSGDHEHAAEDPARPRTFWALFVLFVLGPCEPLIPLFVLPASRGRWDLALATILVFAIVTVATMLFATTLGLLGARKIQFGAAERYAHAMAGAAVATSGLMVIGLGL
jgi:hypothetical protein